MDGPPWSFLLDLGPIRRALEREIARAVDREHQAAEEALGRARERHRKALREREDQNAEQLRDSDELRQRIADLETTNQELRKELVAERHAGESLSVPPGDALFLVR